MVFGISVPAYPVAQLGNSSIFKNLADIKAILHKRVESSPNIELSFFTKDSVSSLT